MCGLLLQLMIVVTAIDVTKSLPNDPLIIPDRIFNLMGKNAFLLHMKNVALLRHTHSRMNIVPSGHYAPYFSVLEL